MLIPFHSPRTLVRTTTASMHKTNEDMLRIIDRTHTAISDTRKRIAGANALMTSACCLMTSAMPLSSRG